jgi:hypothetical protein
MLGSDRIEKLFAAITTVEIPSMLETAAELVRIEPTRRDYVIALIRRGLGNRRDETVNCALRAINGFIRVHQTVGAEFPAILASDVATLCAVRREPGLANALWCAHRLLAVNLLSPDEQARIIDGLQFLLEETSYENWNVSDPRTRSLSLIRRECVHVADLLAKSGVKNATVQD